MTRYNGNTVGSGGQTWHVWVDVTDDGGNTGTATNVHYTYGVWLASGVMLSHTFSWSDAWGSGSAAPGVTGSGDRTINGPNTNAATIQYGGGNSIHFHMAYAEPGFSTTSVDFDYPLPARTPVTPDAPGTSAGTITSSSAQILVTAPGSNGGAGIDDYETYILTTNVWPFYGTGGNVVAVWHGGSGTASGLTKHTTYYYTSRAHNSAGWSGWTNMGAFTTLATVPDAPGTSADTVTSSSAHIVVAAPGSNGGAGIDAYETYVLTTNQWPFYGTGGNVKAVWSGGTGTAAGLIGSTTYYYTSRAHNSIGWSGYTAMKVLTTLPGVHLRVSGAWGNARPHNRVSGAWVGSKTHGRVSGAWS